MKALLSGLLIAGFVFCSFEQAAAQQARQAYRLNAVDLNQRVIWGGECGRTPMGEVRENGQGLAFGGQDQDTDDGWVMLDIKYATGERFGNTTRAFPHSRSDGLMYDARRKLIWGTDTNSQVYVLRLDPDQIRIKQ